MWTLTSRKHVSDNPRDAPSVPPRLRVLLMGKAQDCTKLCTKNLTAQDATDAKRFIREDYKVEWIVDNLPGAVVYVTTDSKVRSYVAGFPLGKYDPETDKAYINNHVNIKILYETKVEDPKDRLIVGFEIYPVSYKGDGCPQTIDHEKQEVENQKTTVKYTYSVKWEESNSVTWQNRWDTYLVTTDPQIHWYSIINSIIIMLFLTAMVAIIMLRTLNKDIASYNDEEFKEEQEDATGWKLVHGDVFRPPKHHSMLAPVLGSGVQITMMTIATMFFAIFGILNPSYRGGLISFALFLFVLSGAFAGYYSARLYKVFKGASWQRNAVNTALIVPGFLFSLVFILNLFVWSQHSSSAIPFGTFFALVLMWFGISLPLVFIGAYFGNRKKVIEHPVRTNQIPRQIPDQVWYLKPVVSIMVGGLMPFAVIFIELFFILKFIWQDQFYYMFGFLGLVFVILVITCIEITVVITITTGGGARSSFPGRPPCTSTCNRWPFLDLPLHRLSLPFDDCTNPTLTFPINSYSVFYYTTRLRITGFVPGLIYFVNSFLACFAYGLCTGTLGFFATYWFMRKIYAAIKVRGGILRM
ncbi:Endomembrane protein 70-domain-containing protein [Jimgerdemannia flammicorona]|uniref:Transmembrane 9 superfamily member n=1 Tax=Jimgerdemannia flammicorona TaxID=994334 RepID=A0A433DHM8_9FUNG|nr:Endomembrane protein 70-domain-containing protein [Jimgerdemannia flammicorona]